MDSSAAAVAAPASEPDVLEVGAGREDGRQEWREYLSGESEEYRFEPIPSVDFLSEAEERDLISRAKAGEPEALHRIVYTFYPTVARAIWQLTRRREDYPWHADLQHDGCRAILEAVESFDPDWGTGSRRFGGYARTVVWHAVVDAFHAYNSVLHVNREALRFRRKFKRAERAFIRDHDHRPWYGEVAPYVAEPAREELVAVWGQLWPSDPAPDPLWPEGADTRDVARQLGRLRHNPASRLQAWADGMGSDSVAELAVKAERVNRMITCIGVLLSGLKASDHPVSLNVSKEVAGGGDAGTQYENPSRSEYTEDVSARPGVKEAAQEQRARQDARSRLLARLAVAADLPQQMAYVVAATLGLDGRGSRTPEEIAEELSALKGSPVRAWSVSRSLERAGDRIREFMASPVGMVFDPFTGQEPEGPEPGVLDPFAVVEAERAAARKRPYVDPFEVAEGEEAAAWQAAVRKVMGPEQEHGPAPPSEDDVDDRPWTDPLTGRPYRSAPRLTSERLIGARAVLLPALEDEEGWGW